MKTRIPLNALQKALYSVLTTNSQTPIYDDVPKDVSYPFVTFGLFTSKPGGGKVTDLSSVTITLNIWSEYSGKSEVNAIAEELIEIISTNKPNLREEDFSLISIEYDMLEAFPEAEDGYRAAVTFVSRIQNLRRG